MFLFSLWSTGSIYWKDGHRSPPKYHHNVESFWLWKIRSIYSKDSALFAATVHHVKVETGSPSVLHFSINFFEGLASIFRNRSSAQSRNSFSFGCRPVPKCPWKDEDPSAATDHHRKVETVSLLVLHVSINLFKGRTSVCSKRSSSQSRNSFS